ncbi:MAG: permease-like cell division protein FtsX [Acutalibacteraceae bacterium]|jgi:cell division transport system permease protein|nr:ABC transporter permease [Clostridiales bacterium]
MSKKEKINLKKEDKKRQNQSGSSLSYLTKEGFRSVWANRLMSVASIAVLTSCLVMIGCATLLFLNIDMMLGKIESQNIIMVFIKDDLSQGQINKIGKDIRTIPNIEKCEFVSKEDSYKQQLKSLGDDAELLSGIQNPLPNAYKVTLKSMNDFSQTVSSIKSVDNILNIRENSTLAKQLAQARRTATFVSAGIITLLLVVSLFIIANTVRVTMFNRRLEISIMKAVGATNWFVRWPFIVEGILLGMISSIVSLGLVFVLYSLTTSSIAGATSLLGLGGSAINFIDYMWQMLLGFVIIGVIAGTSGSIVSMGRYLKEQGSVISE